jgi:peptidoglycan/LPS O-acetylase OafA/YrhL
MELSLTARNIAVSICLTTLSGMVYADDTVVNLDLPTAASFYTRNIPTLNAQSYTPAYLLAATDGDAVLGQANVTPHPAEEFKPPWMSGRKAHQYLGLGTLALFGLTALTAPDNERNNPNPPTTGTHQSLGRATAAMAAATMMTGLIYHWNDIHWEDPFTDPDKMHARLAATGALLMIYAVSVAPAHNHSGAGIAGGAAMVVAVKLTW